MVLDVKILSSITRLANYMPLGSYVIYTALETYSFSLGATPAPVKTIVETPTYNYTCYYFPGNNFSYTSCSADQSNALKVSLAIGFFLATFLSFLKQVPKDGTPPLALPDDDALPPTPEEIAKENRRIADGRYRPRRPKYRAGVVYAQGNVYYMDFGDFHVWGHALLSVVAFGTLSLFSASVSQCLFPTVRPWIFVFTQVVLLVICCFIAMFWVDDPSLSFGLMVVPPADTHPPSPPTTTHSTQTATADTTANNSSNTTETGTGAPGAVSRIAIMSKRILNKASNSLGRKNKNPTTRREHDDACLTSSDDEGDENEKEVNSKGRLGHGGDKEELEMEDNAGGVGSDIQPSIPAPAHVSVKIE
ncbi:hypothetical protein BGZ94_007850 [Podila epigama]|nr:hypothetical protein BGZ94_007850 [Podila epigama]